MRRSSPASAAIESLTIRPATESDAPEAILEHIANPRCRYLVAVVEGKVAGVLGIRDGRRVLHLFVAESLQRRGIASTLWDRARTELLAAADAVERVVNSSIYAVPVYERFGFEASGPRVVAGGVSYVPMQLTIRRDDC